MEPREADIDLNGIMVGTEKLYSPVEVAFILGLTQETIQDKCRTGQIEAHKVDTQWRITGTEVKRYIREGSRKVRSDVGK